MTQNKNKNDYPKDMNDPRWFDREYGAKAHPPLLPDWTAILIFKLPLMVGALGVPLLIIGAVLEKAGIYTGFGLFR